MAKVVSMFPTNEAGDANQAPEFFLSEEEVRSFPKYANASPEEIQEVIHTLHELALISYELFCSKHIYHTSKAA